jgi:hypothetical protein
MLKLEIASHKFYDTFKVTASAFGNDVKESDSKTSKSKASKLPKASFDGMAAFLGAM